jgi:hypothetical protein
MGNNPKLEFKINDVDLIVVDKIIDWKCELKKRCGSDTISEGLVERLIYSYKNLGN